MEAAGDIWYNNKMYTCGNENLLSELMLSGLLKIDANLVWWVWFNCEAIA